MSISGRVLARFLRAKSDKKRMIVMMGPPAAGKGFFLGEPPKTGPPPNYGWKLPKMLVDDEGKPLLTEDDIPERPAYDESDNHLRALQQNEAVKHFSVLKAAHEQGDEAFKKALDDHWYDTKDGGRVELSSVVKFDEFPKDFGQYFEKANTDFYVSMRGWHDDPSAKNETTGKPKERFKDQARHVFDESISRKVEQVEDMLIVDSAGEDIDAQDFKGQIEEAKQRGYEVTVIFLHPEQADTELSNLARGKVMKKRMVDQVDISNWYERNSAALQDIQAAAPDNFCHYRKGPPDPDPKKAAQLRAEARATMNKLATLDDTEKKAAVEEVNHTLYQAAPYKFNKETSYGVSLRGSPKKPEVKSIADEVSKMDAEATARVKPADAAATEKDPKTKENGKAPKPNGESLGKPNAPTKKKEPKTRMDFVREEGDRKVPNPNPESRDRFPRIKIRSLPWTYQKQFYQQWAQRTAATRVLARYRRMAMADDSNWLESWIDELANEIGNKLKVEDYEVKTEGLGPQVFVTIEGASEDATTARKARQQIEKLMEASIKKNTHGVPGFKVQVRSFNKGADLLLECTVIFP